MKSLLRSLALSNDVFMGRATDPERLRAFFAAVRPLETNHALIRVGGKSDGGYLVPDDLSGIETCFSPGVSQVADFESALAARGIRCFLADNSVDGPPVSNALFDFEKKHLGPEEAGSFMTLESWVQRKAAGNGDSILQMDIEEAEYPVILETSLDTLRRFRVVVVEFHQMQALLDKLAFEFVNLAFARMLRLFDVVHIHPNNSSPPILYKEFLIPPTMEFTFLRKDRVASRKPAMVFPHPLDRPCVPSASDFPLPRCWYP
jgi:hypothetical protein